MIFDETNPRHLEILREELKRAKRILTAYDLRIGAISDGLSKYLAKTYAASAGSFSNFNLESALDS